MRCDKTGTNEPSVMPLMLLTLASNLPSHVASRNILRLLQTASEELASWGSGWSVSIVSRCTVIQFPQDLRYLVRWKGPTRCICGPTALSMNANTARSCRHRQTMPIPPYFHSCLSVSFTRGTHGGMFSTAAVVHYDRANNNNHQAHTAVYRRRLPNAWVSRIRA